jgi:hypothetical protein
MLDLVTKEPWLVPATLGIMIPMAAIACGFARSARRARLAELEVSLKHDMLQRGMSADDIVRVLAAGSRGHGQDRRQRRLRQEPVSDATATSEDWAVS